MALLQGRPLPTKLRRDKGFQPCVAEPGDETYANGIFEFNITRLLAFAQERTDRFSLIQVEICELPDYGNGRHLNEVAILVADLARPIVLAEISPGHSMSLTVITVWPEPGARARRRFQPTEFNVRNTYRF